MSSSSKRIFAAIAVPDDVCSPLISAQDKLKKGMKEKNVKWLTPDLWHVTAWFFGDVDGNSVAVISEKLRTVAETAQPFDLQVTGIGAFPDLQAARLIWAGVNRPRELMALRATIEQTFLPEVDKLEFVPHITLGRMKNAFSVRKWTDMFARKKFFEFRVHELVLYESRQQNYISVYTPLERYRFGSSPSEYPNREV